mgnify:CR=1 FL=1
MDEWIKLKTTITYRIYNDWMLLLCFKPKNIRTLKWLQIGGIYLIFDFSAMSKKLEMCNVATFLKIKFYSKIS